MLSHCPSLAASQALLAAACFALVYPSPRLIFRQKTTPPGLEVARRDADPPHPPPSPVIQFPLWYPRPRLQFGFVNLFFFFGRDLNLERILLLL